MSNSPYQAFIVTLLHQDTSADHPDKKSRLINRNVCTRQFLRPADVKDIFDHMRKPKPYWNKCLVTSLIHDELIYNLSLLFFSSLEPKAHMVTL